MEDLRLLLAESLSFQKFATLPSAGDGVTTSAIRPDPQGRSITCSPIPVDDRVAASYPGLSFRAAGDGTLEAVRFAPPTVTCDGEDIRVAGGSFSVIGSADISSSADDRRLERMACSNDARLLLLGWSDGSVQCYNVLQVADRVQMDARWEVQIRTEISELGATYPTLEFVNSTDSTRYQFVAVVEGQRSSRAVWMDALSSSPENKWPTAAAPGNVSAVTAIDPDTFAFGTWDGKLGIVSNNAAQYMNVPLDDSDCDGPWKITHISNSGAHFLVVGASRIIKDPDAEVDEDEEDDPHEHQANLLVANYENFSDESTFSWSELGDVVPFFSVPKGGRHAFYTAALPTFDGSLILVGCNVASDVAIVASNGDWEIIELQEGKQISCPTSEDDEFLFAMGLSVSLLPYGEGKLLGCPILANTDGSLTGFLPHNKTMEGYFVRSMDVSAPDMRAPLPILNVPTQDQTQPSTSDGCILSGLDLGLDGIDTKSRHLFHEDEGSDSDQSSKSSEDSVDSDNAARRSAPASGGFVSSAASFSFAPSTLGNISATIPTKPLQSKPSKPTAFGTSQPTSAGGFTFGSTSTIGAPLNLGARTITQNPNEKTPPSKPSFGSGSIFGGTSAFAGGFGSLASGTLNAAGFGQVTKQKQEQEKKEVPTDIDKSEEDTTKECEEQTAKGMENRLDKKAGSQAEEQQKAPVFGSGGPVPTFGSGGAIPTFGFKGEGFAAFGAVNCPSGAASLMSKPLLTTSGEIKQSVENKSAESKGVESYPKPEIDSELLNSQPGRKASAAFDALLANTDGSDSSLPVSDFESLVEEVGEGFYGGEFDKQLAIVDPEGTGLITACAFIKWYCGLVNADDGDDESSQGSEIAEEADKARNAFDAIADGSDTMPSSKFGDLLESMGTTYCEEEHRRTLKRLGKDGMISRNVFVDWYIEWLFGDEESEDFSEDGQEDDEPGEPEPKSQVKSEGWGNIFKSSEEGSWKCEVCSLVNAVSADACVACETPRPGANKEGSETEAADRSSQPAQGSIGKGGFTFGGVTSTSSLPALKPGGNNAPGSIGSSGFSFGGAFGASSAKGSNTSKSGGGFSFGGSGETLKDDSKTNEPAANASGFSFGMATNASTGIGSSGFSFGSPVGTSGVEETKKPSSDAFPPLAEKAPTPFASATTTTKVNTSSKHSVSQTSLTSPFPPLATKAPTQFGFAPQTKKESGSAAFPPMSVAAPTNPFSKPVEKKSGSSSAFPPMATKAPTPFSASSSAGVTSGPKKPSSSNSSAFPSMPKTAPSNPFSGRGYGSSTFSFGAKAEKPSSSDDAASNSPQLSFDSKPSSASAFPHVSTSASKFGLFSSVQKTPKDNFAKSNQNATVNVPSEPVQADKSYSAASAYEAELWTQVKLFSQQLQAVRNLQSEAKSCMSSDLAKEIDSLVTKYQEKLAQADFDDSEQAATNQRIVQLFSIQDNLNRQRNESSATIKEQTSDHGATADAKREPLDSVSEKQRRAIALKFRRLDRLQKTAETFGALNGEIFERENSNIIRPSEFLRSRKSSSRPFRHQTSKSANMALLKALKEGYDDVQELSRFVETISHNQMNLTGSLPDYPRTAEKTSVTRLTTRTRASVSHISPRPNKITSPLLGRKKAPSISVKGQSPSSSSSLLRRHKLMRGVGKEQCGACNAKTFQLRDQSVTLRKPNIPDWRSKGKNELFCSSNLVTETRLDPRPSPSAVVKTLFSSPIAGSPRTEWNNRDPTPLKVNVPQKLKTVRAEDAAAAALAKFGTTPEALAEGRAAISRDALESKMPASTLPSTNKLNSTNTPIGSSSDTVNATFPAATIPSSMSRTSAFPPMSKSAPKPLSSALGQPPAQASQEAKSNTGVDYTTALKKFFEKNNPSKVADVDLLLRKYEGKECEMFVTLAKKYKAKNGLDSEFLSRVKDIDTNDIQALTRLYFEVYNKAKAMTEGYESKVLSKYKGREKDMFATMAQQWYTVNPMDLPKKDLAEEKKSGEARPNDPFAPKLAEKSASSFSAEREKPESKGEPSSSTSAFESSHVNPADLPSTSPFASSKSKPSASSSTASPFAASEIKKSGVSTSSSPFAATEAPGGVAPSTSPFAPKQSASTTTSPFASSFGSNNVSPSLPDYNKMLTDFYQKYNPAKIGEVGKALEKYKGKEAEMFKKLAQKYNAPNPMEGDHLSAGGGTTSTSSFGFGNMAASMGSTTTPFSTSTAQSKSFSQFAPAPSPFGGNTGQTKSPFSSTQSATPFGAPSATASATTSSASPFTSTSTTTSVFGGTAPGGAFGSQSATSAPSPFGGQTPAPSPFGQTPASSPFGGQSSTFGQPPAGGAQQFGGRNPRDMLTQFYQQYNPNKVNEVDTLLSKYAGQLEQLFVKLAKKYNLDPVATFGLTPKQTTLPAPSFGSPSVLGGGGTPFGGGSAPSSGFGSFPANSSGGGFAAFASGGGNGFGGIAGGQPVPTFGSNPTPFGAARR